MAKLWIFNTNKPLPIIVAVVLVWGLFLGGFAQLQEDGLPFAVTPAPGAAGIEGTIDLDTRGTAGAKATFTPATETSTGDEVDLVISLKESFKDTNGEDVYTGATVEIVDADTKVTRSSTAIEGQGEKISDAIPRGKCFYLITANASLHPGFLGTPSQPICPPIGTSAITISALMERTPTFVVAANNNSLNGGWDTTGTNRTIDASESNKDATVRIRLGQRETSGNLIACGSADRSTNGNFTTYAAAGAGLYGGSFGRIAPLLAHEMVCYDLGTRLYNNDEYIFTIWAVAGPLDPIQGETETDHLAAQWTVAEEIWRDVNNMPVYGLQDTDGTTISGAATDGSVFDSID